MTPPKDETQAVEFDEVVDGPKQIEESIVDLIRHAHPSETHIICRIVNNTIFKYNHDTIIEAMKKRFDDKLIKRTIKALEAQKNSSGQAA